MNISTKQFITTIFCIVIIGTAFGQKKRLQNNPSYDKKGFHLGFTLGLNSLNYKLIPSEQLFTSDSIYAIEVDNSPGFHLGIVTDLRISDHLNLRCEPGMLFGERHLQYTVRSGGSVYAPILKQDDPMIMPTIYLDVPLLLKFKAVRINNYRPYLIGGGSLKYDLETIRTSKENDGYTLNINPLDYFWELGIGIDFYLVYFKLSTELKLCNGLNNLIRQENTDYSRTIDRLESRAIMFSLHFE